MRYIRIYLIGLLIFCGLALRLANLSENPPGFFPDEASTAYDAWCLRQEGIDQHGQSWPFFFTSFADDLTGTYRYLTLLSQLFFGDTVTAVRLPAAISSCLTLLFLFLSVRRSTGFYPALLAFALLVFSPWHLPYSRTGQRIMLLPLALSIWFWFWLRYRDKPSLNNTIAHWLFLGLSIYTYVAARVVVPLLALFLLIDQLIHRRKDWKKLVLGLIVFVLVLSPIFLHALDQPEKFGLRFKQVSVFNTGANPLQSISLVAINYFSHFSIDYLFKCGDLNIRHSLNKTGVLFWTQIPFLLAGLVEMFRRRDRTTWLVLFWLVISPLPAALSRDGNPHALRSVAMLIPWILISAYGAFVLFQRLKSTDWIRILVTVTLAFMVAESSWVAYDLLFRYPKYAASHWEFGTMQAVRRTMEMGDSYDEIWFTSNAIGADRIIAYELKLPPNTFSKSGLSSTPYRWIYFMPIEDIYNQPSAGKRLFIVRDHELKFLPNVSGPIIRPDKTIAFRFASAD